MTCLNHAADGVSNAADVLLARAAVASTAGVAKAQPADAAGNGASDEGAGRRMATGGVASPESLHSRSAVASARPRTPLSESSCAISTCTASVSAARLHEPPTPETPPAVAALAVACAGGAASSAWRSVAGGSAADGFAAGRSVAGGSAADGFAAGRSVAGGSATGGAAAGGSAVSAAGGSVSGRRRLCAWPGLEPPSRAAVGSLLCAVCTMVGSGRDGGDGGDSGDG